MSLEDMRLTRACQREVTRRHVDSDHLEIKVVNGVCYLNGEVRPVRGVNVDLESEIEMIQRLLKSLPGIKDVVSYLKPAGL
jgi:osmotically-inducible protein OsmY